MAEDNNMATPEEENSLLPGGKSGGGGIAFSRDSVLEAFTAELALTAYRVALRTRRQGTWLDLELDLWKALAAKVQDMQLGNCLGAASS
jgi:hypothetical protein